MRKPIKSVAILKDEREVLKEKSWELSMKYGDVIIEADIIHFMIANMLELIDADSSGLYIIDEEEREENIKQKIRRGIKRG